MLKTKRDINQQKFKIVHHFLLEVVDRVSETRLKVGENSN